MSLRLNCKITIKQEPNSQFPNRFIGNGNNNLPITFVLDFVHSVKISESWQDLTNTAKLVFPRNVYVLDSSGNKYDWADNSIYENVISPSSRAPLFMRGDRISIQLGYFVDNMQGQETLSMPEPQFEGFISKIKNRVPIEIECEDDMWKLKQIRVPDKFFKGSLYTFSSMIREMLAGTDYVVDDLGFSVKLGDFRTLNDTVASVLDRIRKDAGLYSYFRGKTLICSGVVYNPKDMNIENPQLNNVFEFQENIISDSMEYTRKEDVNIAVNAYSCILKDASGTNADGTPKKKKERIEAFVGKINAAGDFGEINKSTFSGDVIDGSAIGFGATTKEELISRAKKYLPKFYYTGFRGQFTTFGLPAVKHGDQIIIRDKKIPERTGVYLVKQVNTEFGMEGFRQRIMLHIRTDSGFTIQQLNAGAAG